jgi:gephyrin
MSTTTRESTYDMVEVESALKLVLERASLLDVGVEEISYSSSLLGRVIGQDIIANSNHPPFRASIMDGYAVVDLSPGVYPIALSITAGHGTSNQLEKGQVSYITTGAPVPDGALAVVKIEDTTSTGDSNNKEEKESSKQVQINVTSSPGKWIREIGSDVAKGSIVLESGTTIGPAEMALLASLGQVKVVVRKKPIVGVMSTGDELVDATSESPSEWKIRDSNRPMLLAAAGTAGAEILDLGIAPDEKDKLQNAIKNALKKVNILITSGGVSMGSHDLVKPLLNQMENATLHFGRVRMKPGKPTTFASLNDGKMFFALPGNPVSSLVAFQLFVEPSIRRLMGFSIKDCHHSRIQVRLTRSLSIDPVRREYHRASLEWREDKNGGEFRAFSTGMQRSSRLLSMVTASALLCLPRANGKRRSLPAGTIVPALLLNRCVVPPPKHILQHTSTTAVTNVESDIVSNKMNSLKHQESEKKEVEEEEMEPTCPCCRAAGRSPNRKKSNKPPPPLSGGSVDVGGDRAVVGVLTVSDRAYNGVYEDRGGPEVLRCVNTYVHSVWDSEIRVVPDQQREIENAMVDLADRSGCDIIITTGGTGPSIRDVTPEATEVVCDRMFPGFGERMRSISMQYVPTAILSRQTAGLRGSTFIINLPGNPGSIGQILPQIMSPIAHCVHLAGGPRMEVSLPPPTSLTSNNSNSVISPP